MPGPRTALPVILGLVLLPAVLLAGEIRVAVAANFAPTLQLIADDFAAGTGHRVLISTGSTGKHYAQIRNGARFDIFLAADAERPALLEQSGIGVPGSRFTYATGRLALWAPGQTTVADPAALLRGGRYRYLAIANPRLAPYGAAAKQVLEAWQLWGPLQSKLVRGENAGQAYQYVATGNAEVGLVALSQVLGQRGAYQVLPETLHAPIDQQALLLRHSPAADAFLVFLKSDSAAKRLEDAGYGVPTRP